MFKSDFEYNGERLYLIKESDADPYTYFFLQTKNNEIIKAVNSSSITICDIQDRIQQNESIGFGSFVNVSVGNCFAYASQMLSPRIDAFMNYINTYLEKISSTTDLYRVISTPLSAKITMNDMMQMDRIGKTSMEIDINHTFATAISELLGNPSINDMASIGITFNPTRGGNAKEFLEKLPDHFDRNILKLVTRAKGEIYSSLTDLYVIGAGGLCDSISPSARTSREVGRKIQRKAQDNTALASKIQEYRLRGTYADTLLSPFLELLERRGDCAS